MNNVTNILIVGVGGQGTILASKVLSSVLIEGGYDVKVSEIHGMSQRGGNVVTQVRFGEKVYSPIVKTGEADIILAFERLEAVRYLPFLKQGGKIIVNTQEINPMPVVTGAVPYPSDCLEKLEAKGEVLAFDAIGVAKECNNPKGVNIVLLGVLSKYLEIPEEIWLNVIRAKVPQKFLEGNLLSFEAGRKLV